MKFFNDRTLLKVLARSEPIQSGYLLKGRINKKKEPKRYYFSLRAGNILSYYTGASSSEPQGVVFLEGHMVENGDDYDSRPTLVLRFPTPAKKPLFLVADSVEELDSWILALSRVGTDYISLTVDELEDQLKALDDTMLAATSIHPSDRGFSSSANPRQRDNPFELNPGEEWTGEMERQMALLKLDFSSLHTLVRSYWESKSGSAGCSKGAGDVEMRLMSGAVGGKEPDLINFD